MSWVSYYSTNEGQQIYQSIVESKGDALKMHTLCIPKERTFLPQLLSLYHIRNKCQDKFLHGDKMLFTKRGYEQSTSEAIAKWKGSLLPPSSSVLIGCGGIGGELLGIVRHASHVYYVDMDQEMCEIAKHNLMTLLPEYAHKVEFICEDLITYLQQTPIHFDVAFVDPDRRDHHLKKVHLGSYSPNVTLLLPLLQKKSTSLYIKVSPMVSNEELEATKLQWCIIEEHGSAKEALLYTGSLLPEIVSIDDDNVNTLYEKDLTPYTQKIDTRVFYLILPGPALRKAHLVEKFATHIGAKKADSHSSLLLSSHIPFDFPSSMYQAFLVRKIHDYSPKEIRAYFVHKNVTSARMYKRHFPLQPSEILRQLHIKEGDSPHLYFTTIDGRRVMIEVDPI